MEPDYTAALSAGLQVGFMLFTPVWAIRLLLQLILTGGDRA